MRLANKSMASLIDNSLRRHQEGRFFQPLMAWREENRVDYLFGLARNERLTAEIHGGNRSCARRGRGERYASRDSCVERSLCESFYFGPGITTVSRLIGCGLSLR